MGNWGYKLTQGDTYLDVIDSFKTYYNLGDSADEIVKQIKKEYASIDKEYSDLQDVIFGIAYGLWLINSLEKQHFNELDKIINNDIGMQLWKDEGEKSFQKRKNALIEFRNKLETPRPTILKRKAIKQYICPFDVGDIITLEFNNKYSGAIVLTRNGDEANKRVKYGTQYIAFSSSIFEHSPSIEEILSSKILYIPKKDGYYIRTIYACDLTSKVLQKIKKIGNIEIEKSIKANFKKNYCFNQGTIDEYYSDLYNYQNENTDSNYKLEDILKSTNTWNEMLIYRYKSLKMDIKIKSAE